MIRFYLAGRYRDQALMREVRNRLVALGHTVISRWIDSTDPDDRPGDEDWETGYAHECAERDLHDISMADMLVLYTGGGPSTRGGMYVELGTFLEIAGPQNVVIVGPRTNVFTYHPEILRFDNWEAFYEWLGEGKTGAQL